MGLIPVTPEHVECLCDNLKPDHQRELAWFGMGNKRGVRASAASCDGHALAAVHGDKLLFIAGVSQRHSIHDDAALIVYLATNDYDRHVLPALRMSRQFEAGVWEHTARRRIEQYLPPPYTAGIRFLEFLGWKHGGLINIGARQAVHMYYDTSVPLDRETGRCPEKKHRAAGAS